MELNPGGGQRLQATPTATDNPSVSPGRRGRIGRYALGLGVASEFVPAGVALAVAVTAFSAGLPAKIWGFVLLVSLGLALIAWIRVCWPSA